MMRSRLVRLLVLFAALWLPLQAVSAIAMPYCKHGAPQSMQQMNADNMHCEHGGNPAQPRQKTGSHACDDCGLCHLAGSGAILISSPVPTGLAAAHDYALPAERPLVSHIPELPQRPPRALA